ncbi:hypothetical protein OQA88_7096 [Cercophora sp. LCS_1]
MPTRAAKRRAIGCDARPIHPKTPKFLSFPAEIRNKIYKLLLVRGEIIEATYRRLSISLSSQLLQTCRQIHTEGLSVLYGENTWEIRFYDRPDLTASCYPVGIRGAFDDRESTGWGPQYSQLWSAAHKQRVLDHIRKLELVINYDDRQEVAQLRPDLRLFARQLKKVPQLNYLRLRCSSHLYPQRYYQHIRVDGSPVRGRGRVEVVKILRTWLGFLRDVKEVHVDINLDGHGILEDEAKMLKKLYQSSEPEEGPPLTDLYTSLEAFAEDDKFCKVSLRNALLATENGDGDGLEKARRQILHILATRLKMVKGIKGIANEKTAE